MRSHNEALHLVEFGRTASRKLATVLNTICGHYDGKGRIADWLTTQPLSLRLTRLSGPFRQRRGWDSSFIRHDSLDEMTLPTEVTGALIRWQRPT